MRKLITLVPIFIILLGYNEGKAQKSNSDMDAIPMLKEFYTAYNAIWAISASDITPDTFDEKLDSLRKVYCTSKLRSEAKKVMEDGYGHDLLTNDLIGDVNENLKVEKNTGKDDSYIVSFMATYFDAPRGSIKKQVTLYVRVVKEGNSHKIDDVK